MCVQYLALNLKPVLMVIKTGLKKCHTHIHVAVVFQSTTINEYLNDCLINVSSL